MASDHDPDPAPGRYAEALSRHGIQDVQPLYRQFLRRLKAGDAKIYEGAVERYETDVLGAATADSDPLLRWIRYGAWLADRITPGRLVAIDRSGRAEKQSGPPPLGPLLVHLPEDRGERAMAIAVPAEPSSAQEATQRVLCS